MKDWSPIIVALLICSTVVAIGIVQRLGYSVTIACSDDCRSAADLAAQQSMAAAAWWMLAVSCLSLVATVGGILFVRASLAESKNATRIAADQVKLSRHALISTDRAFVFYAGCTWLSYKRADGSIHWGITVHWRNSGNTPAINIQTAVSFRASDEPLPGDWDFSIPMERVPITLLPGSALGSHPEFIVTPDQIVDANAGKLSYHIWGTARYSDVFDGTPIHESRFCVRLNGYGGDPRIYFDDKDNPVQLYFVNEDAHQSFS